MAADEDSFTARARKLSPDRLRLLERLRDGGVRPNAVPAPAAADATPHAPFPLTDVQQAYWIGRDPALPLGGVAAFGYAEFDVDDLDVDRLERAWNRLIARHPALRTVIAPDGTQHVLATVPAYTIAVEDLRPLAVAERADRLAQLREARSHQVLATDRWPLFDVRATRLEGARVRLHVGFDTLIVDARSFDILANELDALLGDPDASLPPLGFSFRDYVLATTGVAVDDRRARAREHWFAKLDALPPGPALPRVAIGTGPHGAPPRFVRHHTPLVGEAWTSLVARARDRHLTPSSLLLAAFAEVVARWSTPRFTLNLTLFNRRPVHDDIADVVGCFTDLSLLAVDVAPSASFEDRARRLQAQLWSDLEHREVGAMELLRELARRTGAPPLLPVVFTSALGTSGGGRSRLGRPVFAISQTPQVSIDFQVVEADGGVELWWDVAEALFPPGMVRAMFDTYVDLVTRLGEGDAAWTARAPVRLPAASAADRARLERTEAFAQSRRLLHELVDLTEGDRPAVIDARGVTTRRALDAIADGVAVALQRAGVGRGTLVGVVTTRGARQVAAVLGVLRAGGAYVPLSPDLPPARLRELVQRARLDVVVTDQALDLPAALTSIRVDRELPTGSPRSPGSQPGDLAYVIFTSGTTGTPKGVMIAHKAAVNTLLDMRARFAMTSSDVVLALSELSFDLSVFDLFGTLAAGATIVAPGDGMAGKDPARWADLVARHHVTIWSSVPALMGMFVDHLHAAGAIAPDLRLTFLSGDWIPLTLPDRIRRVAPRAAVVSGGGATEAAIWSVIHPIGDVDPTWASIPYGAPLTNQTARVVDADGDESPDWVVGELLIGGAGVALGYWDEPALTADRFIPDPGRPGGRRYRTGDRARHVAGGVLEFLGRDDAQVKVNGHRVDLAEIEHVLVGHPAVARAAVLASGPRDGARRLRAFLVLVDATHVDVVRDHLAAHLPAYMVPAAIEPLDALPLTPNGKVDRAVLAGRPWPEPTRPVHATTTPSDRPRPIAAFVAELVRTELGLRVPPSIDDDLVRLGADSLAMVRLGRRLRERFDFAPSLAQIFADPTIAAVAVALEAHLLEPRVRGLRPALDEPEGWFPLAPAQTRLYVLERIAPGRAGLNVPAVVRLDGQVDADALRRALAAVVARHDALRLIFDVQGTTVVQRALEAPAVPLEVRQADREEDALAILADDARRPFDLARGPSLRALVVELGPTQSLIQITFHHLSCDEHSLRVALGDLLALYAAIAQGRPADLPAPPPPYRRFAIRAAAEVGDVDASLRYWRDRLVDLPPPGPLPEALPSVATIEASARALAALRTLAREERTTITAAVLSVFFLALRAPLDRRDVLVAIPFNGRGTDYADTVGTFVNTMVIRSREPGAATFRELLRATRRDVLSAVDHAAIPYHAVVEAVRPGGGVAELYDAWLVMRERHPELTVPGLRLTPVDVTRSVARHSLKLDLDLSPDGLRGMLLGRAPTWKADVVDRLAAELSAALERIVDDLDRPLATVQAAITHAGSELLRRRHEAAARSARSTLKTTRRTRTP